LRRSTGSKTGCRYTGAFVVISHDRTFLTRLTRQTLWLDRGSIRRKEIGFGGFDEWTEAVFAEEARAAQRLDSRLRLARTGSNVELPPGASAIRVGLRS
jgi:ATPase subunit of ABC transporter with duplicated ATPase domains